MSDNTNTHLVNIEDEPEPNEIIIDSTGTIVSVGEDVELPQQTGESE